MLKIPDLSRRIDRDGEEIVASEFLQIQEMETFLNFRWEKRRREWLAGRVAAKHAACSVLYGDGLCPPNAWHDYYVITVEGGRPYLAPGQDLPDISISHSGSVAVAMACSNARCGIDIQEMSEKIIRVREKFAREKEIALYRQNAGSLNLEDIEFWTLLWSAKEALRKGVHVQPIVGFLELQLSSISGDRINGLIFDFTFSREGIGSNEAFFQTYQIVQDGQALAIFISKDYCL